MLNLLKQLREKPLVVVSDQTNQEATDLLEANLVRKLAPADVGKEIWVVKNEMQALYDQRTEATPVPSAASSAGTNQMTPTTEAAAATTSTANQPALETVSASNNPEETKESITKDAVMTVESGPTPKTIDTKVTEAGREIAAQIVQKQSELVMAQQKLSQDQVYIRRLHDYNYLKDATFQLAETLALIAKVSAKEIFEEFDVRDTEHCFMKTS